MVARILCPTLETMLKKTLLAICEVNIHFDHKLEIGGSLHIRSDGQKVLTFLIDEELPPLDPDAPCDQEDIVTETLDIVQQVTQARSVNGAAHRKANGVIHRNVNNHSGPAAPTVTNTADTRGKETPSLKPARSSVSSSNRRKRSHPVKVEPIDDFLDDSALQPDLESSDFSQYDDLEGQSAHDLMSVEDVEAMSSPSNGSPNQTMSTDDSPQEDKPTDYSVPHNMPEPAAAAAAVTTSTNGGAMLKTCIVRPVDCQPTPADTKPDLPSSQEATPATSISQQVATQLLTSMLPQNVPMSQAQTAVNMRSEDMMLMQQSMMGMMAMGSSPTPPMHFGMQPVFAGMPLKMEQLSPSVPNGSNMTISPNMSAGMNSALPDITPTRGRKPQGGIDNINNLSTAVTDEKGNKKWQCVLCGIMLSSKFYLNSHINAVHTRTRIYPCEICGKLYYSHGAMRIHKLRQHWVDKRHKCPHCPQKFVLPFELRAHIARKHKPMSKQD